MKRIALIFLIFFLSACIIPFQGGETTPIIPTRPIPTPLQSTNPAAVPPALPVPTGAPAVQSGPWPTQKAALAQTATADTTPPLTWTVQFVQAGKTIAANGDVYGLQKAPFTIRVTIPGDTFQSRSFDLFMNVWDRPDNYQKIGPGSIDALEGNTPVDCIGIDPACFVFSGYAEDSQGDGTLTIDAASGTGSHFLSYQNGQGERWTRVLVQGKQVMLERDITTIRRITGQSQSQDIAVAKYTGGNLYLVFVAAYRAGPVVTQDELVKAVLQIQ